MEIHITPTHFESCWSKTETKISDYDSPDFDDDVELIKDDTDIKWPKVENEKGQKYQHAVASCASQMCSSIGKDVLAEGGSAVDAGIAIELALGVLRPTSSGIGGGAFAVLYNRSEKKAHAYDFRETAPAASYSTMYNNTGLDPFQGGSSVAVPSEVLGLWELHQKFGSLSWERLFIPAIKLARDGFPLDPYVYRIVQKRLNTLGDEIISLFKKTDGSFFKPGEIMKLPKLAKTLQTIADEGADTFYTGSLSQDVIADLQDQDSIITLDDLKNYRVAVKDPIASHLTNGNYNLYSVPLPSGGIIIQYMLNILNGYGFGPESVSPSSDRIQETGLTYHRIVEALKFGYAMRSYLGDEHFNNDLKEKLDQMTCPDFGESIRQKIVDEQTQEVGYYGGSADPRITTGTSQISIIAPNGDALSMTTSVNNLFGNKRVGKRTGIIFNNHMYDFSQPGSPGYEDNAWLAPSNQANWIEPGKRPLSAMSPLVITDKNGNVKMVTGGSGGAKIISVTLQAIINTLWFDLELPAAVCRPRFHHQLLPEKLFTESNFPQEYIEVLKAKGHEIVDFGQEAVTDSAAIEDGIVRGGSDPRRLGASDGF